MLMAAFDLPQRLFELGAFKISYEHASRERSTAHDIHSPA
jgi:hypothetical protein